MHLLKTRPLVVEAGAKGLTAAEQFSILAASSLHRLGQPTSNRLHAKICDKALIRAGDQ
jgi:hypothetical protein